MKWNTRRIAAAVIVLPAVLGVAACGKSESPARTTGQSQAGSAAATSNAPAAGQPFKDKASFVAAMKAAGKWAVIDSSSTLGKQLSQSLDQADPTKMYDQFGAAVQDVKYVGEDTVDGEKTWKYDLTLDTKAMQAQLPADAKTQMPSTINYTAWLDEKSQLRKVTFDLSGVRSYFHVLSPSMVSSPTYFTSWTAAPSWSYSFVGSAWSSDCESCLPRVELLSMTAHLPAASPGTPFM